MADERKLPLLFVDFSKDPDYNVEMTDAAMAKALGGPAAGWTAEKVRIVNSQHGVLSNIPISCKGKGKDACPYADNCPLDTDLVKKEYIGKNCPVEIVTAFKTFAGYVIDLEIEPEDYADLVLVADLVRLTLLARRCDLYGKDKPVWEHQIAQIDKQGNVHKNRVPILTFPMMSQIRKDVKEIYDQLIASRAAKVKRDASMKEVKGATDLFSQLRKLGEEAMEQEQAKNRKRFKLQAQEVPTLEGAFEEILDEENDDKEDQLNELD